MNVKETIMTKEWLISDEDDIGAGSGGISNGIKHIISRDPTDI
jgi:hypothetical protein